MSEEMFYLLLREAYKQGYTNAVVDSSGEEWRDGEDDFDAWTSEVMAEGQVGDLTLPHSSVA